MDEQKIVRPAQGEKTSDEKKKPKKKTGDGSDDGDLQKEFKYHRRIDPKIEKYTAELEAQMRNDRQLGG